MFGNHGRPKCFFIFKKKELFLMNLNQTRFLLQWMDNSEQCYADGLGQTNRRICFCQLHFQFNQMEFQNIGLVGVSRNRLIKDIFNFFSPMMCTHVRVGPQGATCTRLTFCKLLSITYSQSPICYLQLSNKFVKTVHNF